MNASGIVALSSHMQRLHSISTKVTQTTKGYSERCSYQELGTNEGAFLSTSPCCMSGTILLDSLDPLTWFDPKCSWWRCLQLCILTGHWSHRLHDLRGFWISQQNMSWRGMTIWHVSFRGPGNFPPAARDGWKTETRDVLIDLSEADPDWDVFYAKASASTSSTSSRSRFTSQPKHYKTHGPNLNVYRLVLKKQKQVLKRATSCHLSR